MTELEKLERELLEQMQEEPEKYTHTEEICTIDPETRTITVPASKRILGVEHDEAAERLHFQCPKVVGDDIDLSLLSLRINFQNAGNEKDQYLVEDVKEDGENITFSWKLSRKVTAYKGKIKFILCAVKAISNGSISNEWNTTLNVDCETLEGLEADQAGIEEETRDVVQQLIEIMKASAQQAVTDVNNAGKTQTDKIQKAGETAVENIQAAAQEIIADREQIQTNKTEIAELWQKKAGAIIETATGDIAVSDSAEVPLENLKLFGKSTQVKTNGYQLFDASRIASNKDIDIINNNDGSFTVPGGKTLKTAGLSYVISKDVIKPGKYTLSLNGSKIAQPYFYVKFKNSSGVIREMISDKSYFDLTQEHIDSDGFEFIIGFFTMGGTSTAGTIKPMVYRDGDGTWEPYTDCKPSPSPDYPQEIKSAGDSGEIVTGVYGKQLLDTSLARGVVNGITFKCLPDGSVSVIGTSGDAESAVSIELTNSGYTAGTYHVRGSTKDTTCRIAYREKEAASYSYIYSGTSGVLLDFTEYGRVLYQIVANKNKTINTIVYPMLYQDGDGTWEPYKTPQSLTLKTPNGLPGIPVTSGGNYTDSTGQQWICDEIDLERGKYVKRVKRIVLNGSERWSIHTGQTGDSGKIYTLIPGLKCINTSNQSTLIGVLSNQLNGTAWTVANNDNQNDLIMLKFSTDVNQTGIAVKSPYFKSAEDLKSHLANHHLECVALLETPIETDLTTEEVEAYKKLHTNYPSTVVTNDANTGMELSYVADTKNFVLGQLAEIVKKQLATDTLILERTV